MIRRVFLWAGVVLVVLYAVFPFYWAVNGSLEPQSKLFRTPAQYLPIPPTVQSYRTAFQNESFLLSIRNSVIVAGGTTLLSLAIALLAASALARFRMRGAGVVLAIVLGMTMFPQISVVGALHSLISSLGLYNTLAGLILSYLLFTLPFTIWVLTEFMRALPRELEESAYIDGAAPLQVLWHVLIPLAMPGIATTGLLAFIAAWNEYLFALSFTITENVRTVPVVIAGFTGGGLHEVPWGPIMAASVTVTVPLVVLVFIFQRRLVQGLTAGALKD